MQRGRGRGRVCQARRARRTEALLCCARSCSPSPQQQAAIGAASSKERAFLLLFHPQPPLPSAPLFLFASSSRNHSVARSSATSSFLVSQQQRNRTETMRLRFRFPQLNSTRLDSIVQPPPTTPLIADRIEKEGRGSGEGCSSPSLTTPRHHAPLLHIPMCSAITGSLERTLLQFPPSLPPSSHATSATPTQQQHSTTQYNGRSVFFKCVG